MEPFKIAPCSNCCQSFSVVGFTFPLKGRLPYTLQCGHSICDRCLYTQICSLQPVKCNDCQFTKELPQNDVRIIKEKYETLKHYFPINPFILGQLTFNALALGNKQVMHHNASNAPCIPAGLSLYNMPNRRQHRVYNNRHPARGNSEIENFISTLTNCVKHPTKTLEFFCMACKMSICSYCLVKNCSGHEFVLAQDQPMEFKDELKKGMEAVRGIELRIKQTIEKLEKKRFTMMYGSVDIKPVEASITNSYAKLHGKLMYSERKLLEDVRSSTNVFDDFMRGLKDSVEMLMNLNTAARFALDNKDKYNVPAIVTALKSAAETPWYLEDEAALLSPNIELIIDKELEESLTKYCTLKMDKTKLKLLATSQLPSYMEIPPLVEDDHLETASQRSGMSAHSSRTTASIDIGSLDFEFRPKDYSSSSNSDRMGLNVNMVRPLPSPRTNEQPVKPLARGMEEDVLVTHVESPHSIYVQRYCVQRRLQNLSESYNQMKETLVAPEPDAIKPGATFITYDNQLKWTRVIVLEDPSEENDDAMCLMKFIDYGHTARISTRRLRVMPEPFVPPFATQVSLSECEPANGTWTEEDNKLIHKIISKSKGCCLMIVSGMRDNICLVDLIADRVTWQENSTSVRDALLFLGHAVLTAGKGKNKIHRSAKSTDFRREHSRHLPSQLPINDDHVVVTSITSPGKFLVRKDTSCFGRLRDQINGWYSLDDETGIVFSPCEGMLVACYVENLWWRAYILHLKAKAQVTVRLVDRGTQHTIPWNHLRKLVPKFMKTEELVSECKLANIKPATGNEWSEKAISFLKNYMEDEARCRAKSLQRGGVKKGGGYNKTPSCYEVLLYKRDENGDPVNINSLLVKEGFAVACGNLESLNKPQDAPVAKPQPVILARPSGVSPTKVAAGVSPTKAAAESGPIKLEVGILSATSPSEIFISIKSEEVEEELKALHKEMQKVYKTTKADNSCDWKNGDKCAALSKRKNKWSRAIIDSVNHEQKSVKVFFKDFGISEEISMENIRPLHPRFLNCRDGALKCHLSGICPASGEKWPMLTCETLQEIIKEYDQFYITKDGDIVDKSLPVELWVYHITPGGALTPTIKEFRKINDRIVENGLAIPSRILLKKKEETPTVSQTAETTQKNSNEQPDFSEIIEPPKSVDNWLPAVPLKSREFPAIATYVEENLDIFLYDVEENSSNLELLSNFLTNYFKESKPKVYDLFWFAGQICITKYDLDNKYYRAQVIEITENNTALVRFVDYGNTQTCPISALRKDIVLDNIPVQSYRCKLQGIKPVKGNKWDQNIGDLVHQSVVDKQSLVTVVGEPEDGVIPIRLKVNMSHDLATLLISLRYAIADDVKPEEAAQSANQAALDNEPDIIVEREIPEIRLSPIKAIDWTKLDSDDEIVSEDKE